jgi:hypothetical protein
MAKNGIYARLYRIQYAREHEAVADQQAVSAAS